MSDAIIDWVQTFLDESYCVFGFAGFDVFLRTLYDQAGYDDDFNMGRRILNSYLNDQVNMGFERVPLAPLVVDFGDNYENNIPAMWGKVTGDQQVRDFYLRIAPVIENLVGENNGSELYSRFTNLGEIIHAAYLRFTSDPEYIRMSLGFDFDEIPEDIDTVTNVSYLTGVTTFIQQNIATLLPSPPRRLGYFGQPRNWIFGVYNTVRNTAISSLIVIEAIETLLGFDQVRHYLPYAQSFLYATILQEGMEIPGNQVQKPTRTFVYPTPSQTNTTPIDFSDQNPTVGNLTNTTTIGPDGSQTPTPGSDEVPFEKKLLNCYHKVAWACKQLALDGFLIPGGGQIPIWRRDSLKISKVSDFDLGMALLYLQHLGIPVYLQQKYNLRYDQVTATTNVIQNTCRFNDKEGISNIILDLISEDMILFTGRKQNNDFGAKDALLGTFATMALDQLRDQLLMIEPSTWFKCIATGFGVYLSSDSDNVQEASSRLLGGNVQPTPTPNPDPTPTSDPTTDPSPTPNPTPNDPTQNPTPTPIPPTPLPTPSPTPDPSSEPSDPTEGTDTDMSDFEGDGDDDEEPPRADGDFSDFFFRRLLNVQALTQEFRERVIRVIRQMIRGEIEDRILGHLRRRVAFEYERDPWGLMDETGADALTTYNAIQIVMNGLDIFNPAKRRRISKIEIARRPRLFIPQNLKMEFGTPGTNGIDIHIDPDKPFLFDRDRDLQFKFLS